MTTMLSDAAQHTVRESAAIQKSGSLLWRKIWLPKFIYSALPFFYVIAGIAALLGTIYISDWFWILPHYLLFSVACVHLGIFVYRRRHRRS
ncbi:MAG: hypothetical protein GWN47_11635 [Woeseiaceae bacterium]|nr:hypothetical protein [Woeseiaceae bacterium]